MAKDSFILYHSVYEHIEGLSDEEIGKLTRAIFLYEKEGEEIELSPVLKMAFSFIKKQLDLNRGKYQEKCEKNKNSARKRWDSENANECERIKHDAKYADTDNDSVSDTDNDNDFNTTTSTTCAGEEKKSEGEIPVQKDVEELRQPYGVDENVFLSQQEYNDLLGIAASKELLQFAINDFSKQRSRGNPKYCALEEQYHYANIREFIEYRRKNADKFREYVNNKASPRGKNQVDVSKLNYD